MNFYEINLLISTDLSEEKANGLADSLISFLNDFGKASLCSKGEEIKLAYPIRKEVRAWLFSLNLFPKETEKKKLVDEIEKQLKQNDQIIRYLIIKKEEKKPQEKPKRKPREVKEKAAEEEKTEDLF